VLKNEIPADVIADLETKFRHISTLIKQYGRKILRNYPITSAQFIALQWFIEEDDVTIGELSNKIGLAYSTTTDLVDRMEKNELVKRVKDPKDRRVVRIRVLHKGETIIREVIQKREDYLAKVLEKFSLQQTMTLSELLSLLQDQMNSIKEK